MNDEETRSSPDEAATGAGSAASSTAAPVEDTVGSPAADDADDEWVPFEGLSQEGLLLVFAGAASGVAALTALKRGQAQPVVVFGAAAAAVALAVVAIDLLSGYVPDLWVHLVVGGGASVAGAVALAGRHWINAITFAVAAALVLYRVVDVEYLAGD
jgi:hypothetical protein